MTEFGKYGAMSAKVRALYGKRLTAEDFSKIAAMSRVSQVADYLRTHPGWRDAMASAPPGPVGRSTLEELLRTQVRAEYIRLASFALHEDKKYLRFYVYKTDLEMILLALRRLMSERTLGGFSELPDFFRRNSGVDYDRLTECKDFAGLLKSVEGGIYYSPLQALAKRSDDGIPDYSEAGIALEGAYFSALYKFIMSGYSGETGDILRRSVGEGTDLLNVTHAMRIKAYFPQAPKSLKEMLLPVHYKLKPEFFERLLAAPNIEAAYDILKASYYGKYFQRLDLVYIEQYYMRYMFSFNRKQIFANTPSIYVPMAYLTLKELEMHRLVNIIECVRYGVPVGDAPVALNENMR